MTSPPTLEVTTPGEREVRVRRAFAAPRALVFECWTKPDLLRRWLLGPPGWEMTGCDVDLRVGGAYRYVWRHEDGELLELNGSFREIVPPSRIVSTETFGDDWTAGATVVTLEFTEVAGGTELTTTVLFSSAEARDAGLATGMTEGMGMGYERLDALLAELS